MDFSETSDPHKELRLKIARAIDNKSSIHLNDLDEILFISNLIEDILKSKAIKYRVRTDRRAFLSTSVAGSGAAIIGASIAIETVAVAAPTVVAALAIAGTALTGVGALALVGIGVHRLSTSKPDYEIVLYPKLREIKLVYKK